MTETDVARLVIWGFEYADVREYQEEQPAFVDGPSRRALADWIARKPWEEDTVQWLTLLGGCGIGKSLSMVRIALALPPETNVIYRRADELELDLLEWERAREAVPVNIQLVMRCKVLLVDDVDRWLLRSPHDVERGRVLYRWDALTEVRDSPRRVNIVSANRTLRQLSEEPGFARWYDRARRGLILEIPGRSRRYPQGEKGGST